jgi:hypothetical protein
MINLILKNQLPFFFRNQFIPNFIVFVLGIFLTYKKYSPILIIFSIVILYFYSYFIHKIFHYFPDLINIHLNNHHNKEENNEKLLKVVNLMLELFSNIMFFVIFFYIQKFLSIDLVPSIIIFFYGFIYVSVHIFNYSIFHTSYAHVLHHKSSENKDKSKTCNYGPDLVDHIFHTNCNKEIENYNHIIPNSFISFLVTYYIYKPQLF